MVLDAEFVRCYFTSPNDQAKGIVRLPDVGSTFGISVSAPGTGKNVYRVVEINEDWSIEVQLVRSSVRDLTVNDVI